MASSFTQHSSKASNIGGGASGIEKMSITLNANTGNIVILSSRPSEQTSPKTRLNITSKTLCLSIQGMVQRTTLNTGVTDIEFSKNSISGFHTAEELGYGTLAPEEVAEGNSLCLIKPLHHAPHPSAIITLNQHNYNEL